MRFSISGININFKEQKGGRAFIDTSNKNRNEDTKKLNTISAEESYKPSPLRSFKTKGFPTYWFAMMAQMAGLNMQMVSRAWLIY